MILDQRFLCACLSCRGSSEKPGPIDMPIAKPRTVTAQAAIFETISSSGATAPQGLNVSSLDFPTSSELNV
jgi:hypothetical protein